MRCEQWWRVRLGLVRFGEQRGDDVKGGREDVTKPTIVGQSGIMESQSFHRFNNNVDRFFCSGGRKDTGKVLFFISFPLLWKTKEIADLFCCLRWLCGVAG